MSASLDQAVKIFDRYELVHGPARHYYGLLAAYGLLRAAEARDTAATWSQVDAVLARFPDGVEHGHYNFPNYRIGGLPQARAYFLGRSRLDEQELIAHAVGLMEAPRDSRGIVVIPTEPQRELIWIDAAMAASPFLLYVGLAAGNENFVNEAARQTLLMYDLLLDQSVGLLHQAYNFVGPGKFTNDHWSRGNGWGLFALAELVESLPSDHRDRDEVVAKFQDLSNALLSFQTPNGLWRQEIPLVEAYEESSGTGLILHGFGVGVGAGVLPAEPFEASILRGANGLRTTSIGGNGETYNSCPGTLAPGNGEVADYLAQIPHVDEPHGAGPISLALVAEHGALVRQNQPAPENQSSGDSNSTG